MDQYVLHEGYNIYKFFYAFKTFVKYEILNNYVDRCYEANCVTCHIIAQR